GRRLDAGLRSHTRGALGETGVQELRERRCQRLHMLRRGLGAGRTRRILRLFWLLGWFRHRPKYGGSRWLYKARRRQRGTACAASQMHASSWASRSRVPMLYLLLKYLHVLGAIVLLGTGAGIAFFMLQAHRSGNVTHIFQTARTVVL